MSFPRVCCQLSSWWKMSLDMQGPEPEPTLSQCFSSAEWLTPAYWGGREGPKALEQKP